MEEAFHSVRGIDPGTLLGLVENTAPFLFQEKKPLTPYTEILLARSQELEKRLSHLDYFSLCLAAHYATVATFVPTDVDNQIRKNLWDQPLPNGVTEAMAELTLLSLQWDFRPVTTRFQEANNYYVSGHQGEWFSVAVGAYAAHREKNPALADRVMSAILKELKSECGIFLALKKAKNGVGLLRSCTLIAHNLGDLDRVIDQWELPENDRLRNSAYKLGHEPHPTFGPEQTALLEAGALNKAFMASENHRHYPLRKPKCLRRSINLILPTGPFFDSWGEKVARHPALSREEVAEVVGALLEGFQKLSSPKIPLYGYARAIGGIQRAFPGGPSSLSDYLPAKAAKLIKKGELAEINRPSREQFEQAWGKRALAFLKVN